MALLIAAPAATHAHLPCGSPSLNPAPVSSGDLKKHEMQHTGEKPYGCPMCGYRAAGMDSIHRHFASIHSKKVRAGAKARWGGGW
jgi:hypothetical protein